ncbi:MAG: S46 family peptidase [Bacteroidota bacterium]
MRRVSLFLVFVFSVVQLSAKEGMWIPILLEKYNLAEMQEMGLKLTAQDIYDVNHSSMKDAVVIFGGGCTGELISGDGLLITNHHCGYRRIQSHSSVEHDYLTDGFWAMSRDEELPNERLTVSFLEYMQDVTSQVLEGTENLTGDEKDKKIKENSAKIQKEATEEGKFRASVKPLFYGNQYFLYVYKVYKDVRLVGAPPSAIGKFGGDTDNWMWPRHTGDFSLFRVYADADNEPAEYSPDNVPYKPKKFFPVSMKGVEHNDFTMVFGIPGRTMQYWPHQEVEITMNQRDPDRIMLRDKKLEIIGADMESDPKIRIQYAAKYQSISNAWKKWQGEIKGLERLDAVNKKLAYEEEFKNWAIENGTWESEYKAIFESFEELYTRYAKYIKASDYYSETVFRGVEIFRQARLVNSIINNIENKQPEKAESLRESMLKGLPAFLKDFNQPTDEKLFAALMPMLREGVDAEFLPVGFIKTTDKFGSEKLVKKVYIKSVLLNHEKLEKLLKNGPEKQLLKLRKDPLVAMFNQLNFKYETNISPQVKKIVPEINSNMKLYTAGLMEMKKDQAFYPDANMTLRVTYGKVEGYEPKDGVKYKHYTTLSGIIAKDNPEIYDYDVPDRLKELYHDKDFGKYEVEGDVPVCFTASNHTTSGNSGSPVVNGNGELIGVNFDRGWEGTMSDIMFDPERCRNIALDVRYVLFIIDKFAGAGYLLDEMEIVY